MNIPVDTKPALWGAAGGALAVAFLGFTWGGWVTGAKAEAAAIERTNTAVIAAMAPVCVEKFKRASDSKERLTALRAVDSWSRAEFVEKGGWAAIAGQGTPERITALANACAILLIGS